MKYSVTMVLLFLSCSAYAGPITYLLEGHQRDIVDRDFQIRLTFQSDQAIDQNPSSSVDELNNPEFLSAVLIEYFSPRENGDFSGAPNVVFSNISNGRVDITDSDMDRIGLLFVKPLDFPTMRFSTAIEIDLGGLDLFAPGSGSLFNAFESVTALLDNLDVGLIDQQRSLFRTGGGIVPLNITSVSRLSNSVPEPSSLLLLLGLIFVARDFGTKTRFAKPDMAVS